MRESFKESFEIQGMILLIAILATLLGYRGRRAPAPSISDLSQAGITSVELYDRRSGTVFVLTSPSQIDALVRILGSWHGGWQWERDGAVNYPVWMTLKAGSTEMLEIEIGEDRVYALQGGGEHWHRKWRSVERRDTAEILRIFWFFSQRQQSTPGADPRSSG